MEHVLIIKKVIAGGKGLATLADGMVVMVPGVLPGETVTVRETRSRKGFKEAALVRIEAPAPERITPPCPHAQVCGGCDLQHAAYPLQLRLKQQILGEALERAGLAQTPVHPTLPSPQTLGYRSRLRLHLDPQGRLGFHRQGSNTVVAIDHCPLATAPLNRVLGALVGDGWPKRLAATIQALELLHSPADDRVVLVLHSRPGRTGKGGRDLAPALAAITDAVVSQPPPAGSHQVPALLHQDFARQGLSYRLSWDHRCFFQANALQNLRLIDLALGLLPNRPGHRTALDLFCGMGNFSLPLALAGLSVTGIEHNRHSVHWAEANCHAAGLMATKFVAADVEAGLQALVADRARFDCLLLDPPRQGLGKASALLPQLQADHIVAISCDPATQARDVALLVQHGYQLRHVVPVDMFPQTHHIESIALLERI